MIELTKNNCYKREQVMIKRCEEELEYTPKALIVVIDEMNEVMSTNDYKAQGVINDCIESIARLGRAAGCHLVLAAQRPSGGTISNDLKNNIKHSILFGEFDSAASTLIFDDDKSSYCKPNIAGRGFSKNGEITEFQSYYYEVEEDDKLQKKNFKINPFGKDNHIEPTKKEETIPLRIIDDDSDDSIEEDIEIKEDIMVCEENKILESSILDENEILEENENDGLQEETPIDASDILFNNENNNNIFNETNSFFSKPKINIKIKPKKISINFDTFNIPEDND